MKILIINLDGADPERLLGDERLTHLRQLMAFGCYGRLERVSSDSIDPSAPWDPVLRAGGESVSIGVPADSASRFDAELGSLLEQLTDEAVVLVVSPPGPEAPGAFVLAAPHNPLSGEIEGAHLLDLAPTLLELAGLEVPPSLPGRSLVGGRGPDPRAAELDDEALVRERLRGLGYLGP